MEEYEIEVELAIDGQKKTEIIVFDLYQYQHASEDPNSFGADPERRKYIKEVLKRELGDDIELVTSLHAIKSQLDEALEEYEYNSCSDIF